MAVDLYLVIPPSPTNPPISGDPVTDQYFKTAFPSATVVEIRQFSVGSENLTTVGSVSGGAGAGKTTLKELVVEKSVDTASRALFSLNATGGHLAKMQIYLRKTGVTAGKPYLVYAFSTVFLSKIDWSATDGDDQPIELLTFAYGAMGIGYYPQKPDGTFGTSVKSSWSQLTNSEATSDILTGF